jgi:hypothetical protein
MERMITFRKLKENCLYHDRVWVDGKKWVSYCVHEDAADDYSDICRQKNCPVWRKLKKLATTDRQHARKLGGINAVDG